MSNVPFNIKKYVSELPKSLQPNMFYAVREGAGYNLYLTDTMGNTAHALNRDTANEVVKKTHQAEFDSTFVPQAGTQYRLADVGKFAFDTTVLLKGSEAITDFNLATYFTDLPSVFTTQTIVDTFKLETYVEKGFNYKYDVNKGYTVISKLVRQRLTSLVSSGFVFERIGYMIANDGSATPQLEPIYSVWMVVNKPTVTPVTMGGTGVTSLSDLKKGLTLDKVDNTADNTKNVLTAVKLIKGVKISLTGDVSGTVTTDMSTDASITVTIPNSTVTTGNYTTTNNIASNGVFTVPGFVVNSKGVITSAINTSITALASTSNYGFTKLYDGIDSVAINVAATPNSVKQAYDLAFNAIPKTQLGANNGVATLDGNGKVPTTQLPSFVDDVLEFASFNDLPSTGESGKIYVTTDTNKPYRWTGSTYIYITSGSVDSVAGKTGVVTLNRSDVGLGNVDNTADVNKVVSAAGKFSASKTVNITGDATGTLSTDFSGTSSVALTLANSGVNANNYGMSNTIPDSGSFSIPKLTINSKGIVTAGTQETITAIASTGQYGFTRLNNNINSTSTSEAATPNAVKQAYDLANKGFKNFFYLNGDKQGTVDDLGCLFQVGANCTYKLLPAGQAPAMTTLFFNNDSKDKTLTITVYDVNHNNSFIYFSTIGFESGTKQIQVGPGQQVELTSREYGEWDVTGGTYILEKRLGNAAFQNTNFWNGVATVNNGCMEIGQYLDFHKAWDDYSDYACRLSFNPISNTLDSSHRMRLGDGFTAFSFSSIEYRADNGFAGLLINNTSSTDCSTFLDMNSNGIVRGGLQSNMRSDGSTELAIRATEAGDKNSRRERIMLSISQTGMWSSVYGWLHDCFAKLNNLSQIIRTGGIQIGAMGSTIAQKKLTGTCPGGVNTAWTIDHGLDRDRIIDLKLFFTDDQNNRVISGINGYRQYNIYISGSNIRIEPPNNVTYHLNKGFGILITYEL